MKQGWRIAKDTMVLENDVQRDQDFMFREWRTIRRAGADLGEASRVFNAYWTYIRAGLYVMWYHRFYTKQSVILFLLFLQYVLWALSADRTLDLDASTFVPLVAVISNLGNQLQGVWESILTIMISGAQLDYLAWLLNMDTDEFNAARKMRMAVATEGDLASHREYVTKINTAVEAWEKINERDASAIAQLIATTEALGRELNVSTGVLDDAKELMNWCAPSAEASPPLPAPPLPWVPPPPQVEPRALNVGARRRGAQDDVDDGRLYEALAEPPPKPLESEQARTERHRSLR